MKLEYSLFDELFKQDNLQNIYSKFCNQLLKIGIDNIPENYKEISEKNRKLSKYRSRQSQV